MTGTPYRPSMPAPRTLCALAASLLLLPTSMALPGDEAIEAVADELNGVPMEGPTIDINGFLNATLLAGCATVAGLGVDTQRDCAELLDYVTGPGCEVQVPPDPSRVASCLLDAACLEYEYWNGADLAVPIIDPTRNSWHFSAPGMSAPGAGYDQGTMTRTVADGYYRLRINTAFGLECVAVDRNGTCLAWRPAAMDAATYEANKCP